MTKPGPFAKTFLALLIAVPGACSSHHTTDGAGSGGRSAGGMAGSSQAGNAGVPNGGAGMAAGSGGSAARGASAAGGESGRGMATGGNTAGRAAGAGGSRGGSSGSGGNLETAGMSGAGEAGEANGGTANACPAEPAPRANCFPDAGLRCSYETTCGSVECECRGMPLAFYCFACDAAPSSQCPETQPTFVTCNAQEGLLCSYAEDCGTVRCACEPARSGEGNSFFYCDPCG